MPKENPVLFYILNMDTTGIATLAHAGQQNNECAGKKKT